MGYRYNIQGIRAIAVLFVLVFHLNSGLLPGDFIGGLGIDLLLLTAFIYNENDSFSGVLALIPCLGTGLIIISKGSFFSKVISNLAFVKLGGLSYSIYLWHWPIMAFNRYYYRFEITLIDSLVINILSIYPKRLKDLILIYPNIYYLDLTKASVFDDIPYYNDTAMYYDDRYINKFGSIKYAENIEKDSWNYIAN